MKKQFILFYVALIVAAPICFGQASPPTSAKFGQPSPPASDKFAKEAEITDLEKAAWEAFKNKQADAFKKLLSKRYCGVYAEGIKSADAEVADMARRSICATTHWAI
jgi:hypothetical protein